MSWAVKKATFSFFKKKGIFYAQGKLDGRKGHQRQSELLILFQLFLCQNDIDDFVLTFNLPLCLKFYLVKEEMTEGKKKKLMELLCFCLTKE